MCIQLFKITLWWPNFNLHWHNRRQLHCVFHLVFHNISYSYISYCKLCASNSLRVPHDGPTLTFTGIIVDNSIAFSISCLTISATVFTSSWCTSYMSSSWSCKMKNAPRGDWAADTLRLLRRDEPVCKQEQYKKYCRMLNFRESFITWVSRGSLDSAK